MEYTKIPNIFVRNETTKKLVRGEYTRKAFAYLQDCAWMFTEKVDGTNIRVIWDGFRVSFAGRTDKADIPKDLKARLEELFGGPDNEEIFEQTFGNKEVILFGEGYGGKIQGKNGYGDADFIMFDIYIDGFWLEWENVCNIASKFGVKTVPALGYSNLSGIVDYVSKHPMSLLRDGEMEGVVARPAYGVLDRNGDRIIVKVKCRDFKKEDE